MNKSVHWSPLSKVSEMAAQEDFEVAAEKMSASLAATAETIADILPTATQQQLLEGIAEATRALSAIRATHLVSEAFPDFVAGWLAAIVDVLGYAAAMTANEDEVKNATKPPYREILEALSAADLRCVDLAPQLGMDEAVVSKLLDDLRGMSVVTNHYRGRELYYGLAPIGRLLSSELRAQASE